MVTWGTFGRDLRYGLRSLSRSPGFAAVTTLTLALAIGPVTAVYSMVDALVLHPYAFPTDGLYVVKASENIEDLEAPTALAFAERARSLSSVGFVGIDAATLTGIDEPVRLLGYRTSAGYFPTVGVKPLLGRLFSAQDDTAQAAPTVILSEELWRTRFNGDASLIGQTIGLNGRPTTVIGVMAREASIPVAAQLWMPLALSESEAKNGGLSWLSPVVRLAPGATADSAQAELRAIREELRAQGKVTVQRRPVLRPASEEVDPGARDLSVALSCAVVLLLLLACVNIANLLLARATRREHELAVRAALGANRGQLVRQLLAESAWLALAGGLAGVLLGVWLLDLLRATAPPEAVRWVPGFLRLGLNGRVLGAMAGTTALCAAGFGLLPAWLASRSEPASALGAESRGTSASPKRHRLQSALVAAQMALALPLSVGSGLVVAGYQHKLRAPTGVRLNDTVVLPLSATDEQYPTPASRAKLSTDLLARLRVVPGVESAAVLRTFPLDGWTNATANLEGHPLEEAREVTFEVASDGAAATLGIPLRAGREFTAQDDGRAPPVALVSESFARRAFPGPDPLQAALGQRVVISRASEAPAWTIVGVLADARYRRFEGGYDEAVWVPQAQSPRNWLAFVLRAPGQPLSALAPAAREALKTVDPNLAFDQIHTGRELVVLRNLVGVQYAAGLLGGFALLALVLGALGIHGVVSFAVARRRREMGIRLALGAPAQAVVALVVRHGMLPTLWGLLPGIPLSILMARLLSQVSLAPSEPLLFAAGVMLLLGVSLLACWAPAHAATRVDPQVALRAD